MELESSMKSTVWQDENVWTHIDWELNDVTSQQLNWFWTNMEKCDFLWHPNQHHDFSWFVSIQELGKPLGSIHIAPQTWNDGKRITPYIRMEPLQNVSEKIKDIVKYDHVVIVGAISIFGGDVKRDDPVLGYRVHQWQKSDAGVVGMSSAIEANAEGKENADNGLIWAAHACEEVGNWEVFLPDLFRLYKVITDRSICPYYSFKVEGQGKGIKYLGI
jgi:hypothetical protein